MLSIEVLFVSKFFWKGDKNFKNLKSGRIYLEDPVSSFSHFKTGFYSPVAPVLTENPVEALINHTEMINRILHIISVLFYDYTRHCLSK